MQFNIRPKYFSFWKPIFKGISVEKYILDIYSLFFLAGNVNDSNSTSSDADYQNTEVDNDLQSGTFNHFYYIEAWNISMRYFFAEHFVDSSSQLNFRHLFSLEDEESPSLPEQSLQTPHNAQMTGNTVVYSGIRTQGTSFILQWHNIDNLVGYLE